MMKSYFFRLLLQQIYEKNDKMAKKKKVKNEKSSANSLSGVLGFKDIFLNERLKFIFGLVLFGLAIYMMFAFISYFSTGAADQSLIEDPREGTKTMSLPTHAAVWAPTSHGISSSAASDCRLF